MEEQIVFGDEMMPVTLPDNFQSAPPGLFTTLLAVDNIEATVQQALLEPLGRPARHQEHLPPPGRSRLPRGHSGQGAREAEEQFSF